MKNLKIKTTVILFCCLFGKTGLWGQNYLYGNSVFIQQGQNVNVVINDNNYAGYFDWLCLIQSSICPAWNKDCINSITFNNSTQSPQCFTCDFVAEPGTSCCTFSLSAVITETCDYDGTSHNITLSENYYILPYLNGGSSAVLGNQLFLNLSSGGSFGGTNCAVTHSCANAYISWYCNCSSCLSGTTNSVAILTIPQTASAAVSPLTVDAFYNCNGVAYPINPITLNIFLPNDPSPSGPSSIGCGTNSSYVSNNTFTYSTPTVAGATYYVWTYPSFMSPPSGAAVQGSSIALNVTGTGSGYVSVTAWVTPTSGVRSNTIQYPVSICCVPYVNTSPLTLNSSNAGYELEAGSVIDCGNINVQGTGSVTMHAGNEVHLLPGFTAVAGSEVHLYNASCNTGYYRLMAPPDTSNLSNNFPARYNPPTYFSILKRVPNNTGNSLTASSDVFDVFPNPSKGEINLQFGQTVELPVDITVINSIGSTVKRIGQFQQNTCIINLSDLDNGVYAIRVNSKNKTESRVVVKTSN